MFLGKDVLKVCSKSTEEHPCRSAISMKLLCNFIEITRRHGCFPTNLLHIFRTPFLKNTFGWLLLQVAGSMDQRKSRKQSNTPTYYVRKWLQISRSGNIWHFRLSGRKLGLLFQLALEAFNFCLLTVRNFLKRSENGDTKMLYNLTSKILFVMMPSLGTTIMQKLLKVATTT